MVSRWAATFTPRRVQGLRPAVEQIVAQACEQVAGDSDFVACFAFPLPVTVIGELLGIPPADRPMFRDLVRDWAAVLEILGPQVVDRADAAASAIGSYLADGLPGWASSSRPRQPASLRALTCDCAGPDARRPAPRPSR